MGNREKFFIQALSGRENLIAFPTESVILKE